MPPIRYSTFKPCEHPRPWTVTSSYWEILPSQFFGGRASERQCWVSHYSVTMQAHSTSQARSPSSVDSKSLVVSANIFSKTASQCNGLTEQCFFFEGRHCSWCKVVPLRADFTVILRETSFVSFLTRRAHMYHHQHDVQSPSTSAGKLTARLYV